MKSIRPTAAIVIVALAMLVTAPPVAGQDFGRDEPLPEHPLPQTIDPFETPRPRPVPTEQAPTTPRTYTVPAFTIEAISFTAVDETGIDLLGSDEVYATWAEIGGDASAMSAVFGDVDSGDTRYFHEYQRCMYPIGGTGNLRAWDGDAWQCVAEGGAGDVEIRVEMFEVDDFAGFPFLSCLFTDGLRPQCAQSWIGGRAISHTEAELVELLESPAQSLEITVRLGKGCHSDPGDVGDEEPGGNVCSSGLLQADYDFTYRITRLDDQVRYHHDHLTS